MKLSRSWQAKGVQPNLSQLSITTGINRKAVTARVRTPRDPLAPTELSSAAKTLTVWLEMATDNQTLRKLPVMSEGKAPSFESMAWIGSRGNVHHRVILEELVRLGLVTDHGTQVELKADGFIPANDLAGMLAFFADNGRDPPERIGVQHPGRTSSAAGAIDFCARPSDGSLRGNSPVGTRPLEHLASRTGA